MNHDEYWKRRSKERIEAAMDKIRKSIKESMTQSGGKMSEESKNEKPEAVIIKFPIKNNNIVRFGQQGKPDVVIDRERDRKISEAIMNYGTQHKQNPSSLDKPILKVVENEPQSNPDRNDKPTE
jgi:hypothetical protein